MGARIGTAAVAIFLIVCLLSGIGYTALIEAELAPPPEGDVRLGPAQVVVRVVRAAECFGHGCVPQQFGFTPTVDTYVVWLYLRLGPNNARVVQLVRLPLHPHRRH